MTVSPVHRPERYLPDMIGWNVRRPTVEECELVGRDPWYAEGSSAGVIVDDGDTVVEISASADAQEHLARAFEAFGMCDCAHAIPAGVYLEE